MKRTILLIEDNEQNRYLTTYLLRNKGYDVVSADDGHAGIARAEEGGVDLILLDIQLPVMDGYAVAARSREGPRVGMQWVYREADQSRDLRVGG